MHGGPSCAFDALFSIGEDEARARLRELVQRVGEGSAVLEFVRTHARPGVEMDEEGVMLVEGLMPADADARAAGSPSQPLSRCSSGGAADCGKDARAAGSPSQPLSRCSSDGAADCGKDAPQRAEAPCTSEEVERECGFTINALEDDVEGGVPEDILRFMQSNDLRSQQFKNAFVEVQTPEQVGPVYDNRKQLVQRWTFVMDMDAGQGGTPELLHKLLFCLKRMEEQYATACKAGGKRGAQGPSVDNISEAAVNEAQCRTSYGHSIHKVVVDGESRTVPPMDVRLFIDVATTGGSKPLMRNYVFLEVIVPLTFDFMANINYSTAARAGQREGCISDDAKRFWVEIALHQATFGGGHGDGGGAHCGLSARFSSLFDVDSKLWLPGVTTAAHCVRAARRHAQLVALAEVQRSTGRRAESLPRLAVRFGALDELCEGGLLPDAYDEVWDAFAARSVRAWHEELHEYRTKMARFRTQQDAPKDSNFEGEDGPQGPPVFNPVPVLDLPRVRWENEELARRIAEFSLQPAHNKLADLFELVEEFGEDIEFVGFPAAWLSLQVNMTLILPDGPLVSFSKFMTENQGLELPESTMLAMLMMRDQGLDAIRGRGAGLMDGNQTWLRKVLTRADFRRLLLERGRQDRNVLFNDRSRYVYVMNMDMIHRLDGEQKRVDEFVTYLQNAFKIGLTVAKSKTAERGGACPRLVTLCEVGEQAWPKSEFRSCLTESVHKWLAEAAGMQMNDEMDLAADQGTLYGAYKQVNALLALQQMVSPLKPENLDLYWSLLVSDVLTQLSYAYKAIGVATNGIGGVNWIQNFGGNLYERVGQKRNNRDDDGVEEQEFRKVKQKRGGVGADKCAQDYANNTNPNSYEHPQAKVWPFPAVEEIRDSSEQGMQYKLSVFKNEKNQIISEPTELPNVTVATEIQAHDESGQAGTRNMHKILSAAIFRNTGHQGGASRTTVMHNADGIAESRTQTGCLFLHLILLSSNKCGRNYYEEQFNAVANPVPAGADTSMSYDHESAERSRLCQHMGRRSKFSDGSKNQGLVQAPFALNIGVHGVAFVLSTLQFYGLIGHIPPLFENELVVLYSTALLTLDDFTIGLVDISIRNRRIDVVRSRLVALSVELASMHVLSDPRSRGRNMEELVVCAMRVWRLDPCPSMTMPMGVRMLLEQTLDWGFWLVLMLFADYFGTPVLDACELENVFNDHGARRAYPRGQACDRARRWLHSLGFNDDEQVRSARSWDVLFPEGARGRPLQQTGAYVTSISAPDDSVDGSALAFIVQGEARDGPVSAAAAARKVAAALARNLFARYGRTITATCNIENSKYLLVMIERFIGIEMPYPGFRAPHRGARFQSVNSVLAAFGCACADASVAAESDDQGCFFVDGHAPSVKQHLRSVREGYRAPVLVCVPEGGRKYRFGVDVRWLLWVRAVVGNKISQTALRRVFVHLTAEYVAHRVPASVYPYKTMITGTPDAESPALTVYDLSRHLSAARPTTMTRPLPEEAVRENKADGIVGVVDGVGIEEGMAVNPLLHLQQTLRSRSLRFDIYKCSIEGPIPPLRPNAWVPVRLVHRQGGGPVRFQWGAVQCPFGAGTHRLRIMQARACVPDKTVLAGMGAADEATLQQRLQRRTVVETAGACLRALLAAQPHLRAGWCKDFSRVGILVRVDLVPGLGVFAVLRPWSDGEWFHCEAMAHLAFRERACAAPDGAHKSPLLALAQRVAEDGSDAHAENVLERIRDAARAFNDKNDCEVDHADVVRDFVSPADLFVAMSNAEVASSAVGIGTGVLLDVLHPAVLELLGDHVRVKADGAAGYVSMQNFLARDCAAVHCPVLEAMLLYELPEEALMQRRTVPHGVFVGIRQYSGEHKVAFTLYLNVPTRALCTLEALDIYSLHPAYCRVVCDHAL